MTPVTLRDQFAAAAIAGTFARTFGFNLTAVCCDAYAAADELIRIRNLSASERDHAHRIAIRPAAQASGKTDRR